MMFVKNHVNLGNTPTWVKLNEDARKQVNREQFLRTFGGSFKICNIAGTHVRWVEEEDYSNVTDKYVVKNINGEVELVEVFSKFCRENNLNKAAMYGTLNGTRKQHKGYKLVKIPD